MITDVKSKDFANLRSIDVKMDRINVLVGKRGTGKSNFINILAYMNCFVNNRSLEKYDIVFYGEKEPIMFQVKSKIQDKIHEYIMSVDGELNISEKLMIDFQTVMGTTNGEGFVCDINEDNQMKINGDPKLSHLLSVIQYGDKPNIKTFCDFIQGWGKYTFPQTFDDLSQDASLLSQRQPEDYDTWCAFVEKITGGYPNVVELDGEWHLFINKNNKKIHVSLLSYGEINLIKLKLVSLRTGTDKASLVTFRNPEAGLDADGQREIAHVIGELSYDLQIVVETHSDIIVDELITYDGFNMLYFSDHSYGSQIRNLEQLKKAHAGIDGWISDFGIGSAVFDSGLIDDEGE